MKTERLYIDDIEEVDRLRAVDASKVGAIKASIAEIGLRTPVTVFAEQIDGDWRYRLVAGAHRLEALRQLGHDAVDAVVMDGDADDAALWEIDENFARSELTDAQRADHHVRREDIMGRKGLVRVGRGGDQSEKSSLRSYAVETAERLGVSRRTVEKDLARGKNIASDVLAEVAGTDLDKGVVLDELAATPKADQRAKLAEITLRRQEAERARKDAEKVNKDTDRVIAMSEAERFAEWLLARLDLNELPTVIAWLEVAKPKDVTAALRRAAA